MFPPVVAGVWSQRRAAWLSNDPTTTDDPGAVSPFRPYADGTKGRAGLPLKTHVFGVFFWLKKPKAGELSHVSWLKIKTKLGRFYIFNVCFKDFYSGWPVTSLQCFTGKQLHAFVQKQDRKTMAGRGFKLQGEIGSTFIVTKPPRSSQNVVIIIPPKCLIHSVIQVLGII